MYRLGLRGDLKYHSNNRGRGVSTNKYEDPFLFDTVVSTSVETSDRKREGKANSRSIFEQGSSI